MYIFCENACIIDYCTCWVVGEVVSCVPYANGSTFITWFDWRVSFFHITRHVLFQCVKVLIVKTCFVVCSIESQFVIGNSNILMSVSN